MKKFTLVIVAVIVVAGIAVLAVALNHKSPAKANTNNNTTNSQYVAVSACNVLTSSIATQVIGSAVVKGTTPADAESTSDIAFTNCMYSTSPAVDPPHVVSVAVRSAKDSTGAASNKSVFTTAGEPSGTQSVTGYGSAAYWDPSIGQLDVLKGDNWYILTNYTGTAPTNGTATLAMAEQLAQAVKL